MSEEGKSERQFDAKRSLLPRYEMMAHLVPHEPMQADAFTGALELHAQFLGSGGGGGRWATFVTPGGRETGLVLGVYVAPPTAATGGQQAMLDHQRLEGLPLVGAQLAFASLCGVCCRGQNLEDANLQGALLVDSDFTGSSFRRAILRGADLSRCDLVGCDFRDADLAGADCENADLSGADMRGALLAGARFIGAVTDGSRGLGEAAAKSPRPVGIDVNVLQRGPGSQGASE